MELTSAKRMEGKALVSCEFAAFEAAGCADVAIVLALRMMKLACKGCCLMKVY
jgi:hypothetical protein